MLLLAALTGCRLIGGGGNGGPPNIDADCILLNDGGICTFKNRGGPGSRCVRLLVGSTSGNVAASEPLCSGPLGKDGQMTVVVRFNTRPAEMCGKDLADCTVKVIPPDNAGEVATAFAAELKRNNTGPVTRDECRDLIKLRAQLYAEEDCAGIVNPQDKATCVQEVTSGESGEYMIEDCLEYYSRQLVNCQRKAKTTRQLSDCEDENYDR